ncbi:hypothetical protein [Providencia manganoxydans]|uniref:hypothetical protein n=1 Tax=Providencia manganoxydans TaxID=2923283 RepID=UPI0024AC0B1A
MEFNNNSVLGSIVPNDDLINVNGLWYNQKSLHLDGYRFVGCRFDFCNLTISTTRFELIDCYIDGATLTYYSDEVLKVIKLFNSRNQTMYDRAPFFAPIKNNDGTITITGKSNGA